MENYIMKEKPILFIHYGSKKYIPEMFKKIKNDTWIKPKGGLWASPINSNWGWKNWCEIEMFRDCKTDNSFCVSLKENARILMIDSIDDLINLPQIQLSFHKPTLNFEKIAKEYDAIWLTEKGEQETRWTTGISLYGWDCESILIMNKDIIKTVPE